MNSLENHLQETLNLTNSLCIKLTDIARAMNKGLILGTTTYEIGSNPKTWKYYLNLAGIKHPSNNDVQINVIELDQKKSLTKELLEENPYTKNELMKQDDFYKKLLLDYPDDELYIKGCIYPVDIDYAIEAPDGTILNYNHNLVEKSELSLIPELERHIKDFLNRWYIREYGLVDELYTASLQAVLIASIPGKIINIRLDKLNTNEVHSFHLEHFFNSHLKLWNNMSIFKNETKYWLYKNLPYLIKHVGKVRTLNKLATKVFDTNNIGLGEYVLLRPDPSLNTEVDVNSPAYITNEAKLELRALNDAYEIDTESTLKLEQVVLDELNSVVSYIDRSLTDEYVIEETKKEIANIQNNNLNEQPTKILDVRINRFFKNYGIDLFKIIFDYWAYLIKASDPKFVTNYEDSNKNVTPSNNAYGKKINALVDFIDPNSNAAYSITPYQGFLMTIKILLTITGDKDAEIRGYNYDVVLREDKLDLYRVYNKMYKDGYTDILLEELVNRYPKINSSIFNTESFNTYISDILKYYTYVWSLDANSESCIVSCNIKQLYYLNMQRGYTRLIPEDSPINGYKIDELLSKNGIIYDLPTTYDLMLSLNGLVKTFTGYNIDEYYTKDEIIRNAKEFLSKLTAYTTQILTTSDTTRSVYLYYNNISPFRTKHPIIGEIKAKLCPYEHNFFNLKVTGWNVVDDPITIIENVDCKQSAYERIPPIEGIGGVTNAPLPEFDRQDPPRTVAEIKPQFTFNATKGSNIESIDLDIDIDPPEVY